MNERSNKLVNLLTSFNKAQIRGSRKLIASPFFSGNDDLLAIFDEILSRIERKKSLNKKEVWESVFGSTRPFQDARFRKYTSDIFRLLKEFLVQEMLTEEPNLKQFLYLSALGKQNSDKLIRGVEKNWTDLTKSEPRVNEMGYLYQHLLEYRKYILLYDHRPYDRSNIEEMSKNLDIYYIVNKLRYAIVTLNRIHLEKYNYNLKLVPEIVNFLDTNQDYLDHTIVAAYYYVYKMHSDSNSEVSYFKYKNILTTKTDRLPENHTYELFQSALNYGRRRINEGSKEFLLEYLEVYRYGLERNLLYDDGLIDPLQFKNTILIALRYGDYSWAEYYINNYNNRIQENQRENAVKYNSATLYFYQKDYERALEFLRDVEYENTTYNLSAKTMLLAIYYETESDISLDSLAEAIIAYINRHKEIPAINQQAFRNLVSFTRRLTRMLPNDKKAIEDLKTDLATQKYVASRPWLEEKISEFEQRR